MNSSKILETLKEYKEKKSEQYGINRIGLFGSYAKGTAVKKSDVDVVIDIRKPDLFTLVHIKDELEELLNVRVDIVRDRREMNSYLKKHIEKEAIYV